MNKVVLVACVGKKLDHAAPAARLYQSPWFHKARRYAELVADRWWILSAGHGLVAPDAVIAPYDATLRRVPVDRRRQWTREVMEQLAPLTDPARDEIIILAGRAYREFLMMWLADFLGYTVSVPLEGLGIGRQLQWLNQSIADFTGKDVS
jgi:hypothetical protein